MLQCYLIFYIGYKIILLKNAILQLSWGKDRSATNATAATYPYPTAAPAPYLTQIPAAPTVWVDSNGQQAGLQPWMGVYYPPFQPQYHAASANEPLIEDTS
jgi:hypothetical protein